MWNGSTACSCFPLFKGNCSCHMQNWIFLCILDNLYFRKTYFFLFVCLFVSFFVSLFFCNQISKLRSFEKKKTIFDLLFTFFSLQGTDTKTLSAHISLTYLHIFCSPYWLFCLTNFEKKCEFIRYGFSLVWFLMLILIRAILEQSINNKMVSKI